MNFPLITEYITAIKNASYNLVTLKSLEPVFDNYGQPVMCRGNYSVVFKMLDNQSGQFKALKCFTRDQKDRCKRYRLICKYLANIDGSYFVKTEFFEKELFVSTSSNNDANPSECLYPILLMDWVEGQSLDKYLFNCLKDNRIDYYEKKYLLKQLCFDFSELSMWLLKHDFAHGDIKPDNIIVREDRSIILIDYDGMYVSGMQGWKASELGSPNYRHPLRTLSDFDEYIDDFSLVSILTSLYVFSINPNKIYDNKEDALLFSEEDYKDYWNSKCVQWLNSLILEDDGELSRLLYLLNVAINSGSLKNFISLRRSLLLYLRPPEYEATDLWWRRRPGAVEDNKGVLYDKSLKFLVNANNLKEASYRIKRGTQKIEKRAFQNSDISELSIPNTVISIDDEAFLGCKNLKLIKLPKSIQHMGKNVFEGCIGLRSIESDNNPRNGCVPGYFVKNGYLYLINGTGDQALIKKCPVLINAKLNIAPIPYFWEVDETSHQVFVISSGALKNCRFISVSLKYATAIESEAFSGCKNLMQIRLPNSLTRIDSNAFEGCIRLKSIFIPPDSKDRFLKMEGLKGLEDKLIEEECWNERRRFMRTMR